MGDIQIIKLLKDLPLVLSLLIIAFFLIRELLKYLKSHDIIMGKTSVAKIEYDKEVEITQRRTQDELFSLFKQMTNFNREKNEHDSEYHASALRAQYEMIDAVKETKQSINDLANKITLPEEHIIESILAKLQEIQVEFVKYHNKNKEEILAEIAKINKI